MAASNNTRLSAPRITKTSSSVASSAGMVSDRRANGASGGSGSGMRRRMGTGSSARGSVLGNSEAMCPSSPMPSQVSAKWGGVAPSASGTIRAPSGSSAARNRPVFEAG